MRFPIALALTALPTACATAPRAPDWTVFADCAAAYRINAGIADPARPASMTQMVSETADEYEAAALRTAKGGRPAVTARVRETVGRLAPLAREEVEKLIDACPQPE
jgi:hypothetical protein